MKTNINKKNYYSIAILICLLLIFSSIGSFFNRFVSDNVSYIIELSAKIIFFFVMLFYIKKYELTKPEFKRLELFTLLFIPFLLLSGSNIFAELINKSEINNNINYELLIKALSISFITVINEEIVFRGCLLKEIEKSEDRFRTIFVSALIFGLVHLLNINSLGSIPYVLLQVGYSFYLGLILGLMYLSTRNIIIPIIMHMSFNMVNSDLTNALFDIDYNVLYFVVNISIGVIIFIYFLICYTIFKEKEKWDDVRKDLDF